MPEYKAPLRDIDFVLNDLLGYEQHCLQTLGCADASRETVSAVLEEAAKFAQEVIDPLRRSGDEEGCHWENGKVRTPAGFHEAYQQFIEAGWTGLAQPEEFGGQGLPGSLAVVVNEMLASANHPWQMYSSLSLGAIETIFAHGSEDLKQRYLPPLVSGAWSGTMCLTEAHCGSDLGLLKTRAEPSADGSYRISGSKIFISAGEHDLTDNIVHLVLARLPDAPPGVSGISLFLVPKLKVDAQGQLAGPNGVSCGSIEHKMGINANATCVINFDAAEGYLLGEPNKGMSAMFTFINESRLGVAVQGQAHIETSFQGAVAYARERLQMRAPQRARPELPADPIIVHPDVRRMLLTQKAFGEGGRVLNYHCALLSDLSHRGDAEQRQMAQTMLALLTPIAKGFLTEAAMEATQNGVQVLGGHGYIREWGMEQEYRDARITAIYEGTNTIQALDLLGRKILASGGQLLAPFISEISRFCAAQHPDECQPFIQTLAAASDLWVQLTQEIGARAQKDPNAVGAAAFDYLLLAGYTTLAYCWARSASVAATKLAAGGDFDAAFLRAKVSTARFYFERLLPRTQTLAVTIRSSSENLMALDDEAFIRGV